MRILIFHGYMLRGTGSNVYNAELAEALVRLGHDVHLLCQEPAPEALGFVDSVGEWERGRFVIRDVARRVHAGSCTVYRPDIGGLLPVYVYDRYPGFEVRTFDALSHEELEHYISANVAAVRAVVDEADPEIAFANHLVMGPVVLARALEDVPYAVKIHGSALEYTVKPHYARFSPYAREGLQQARGVLVGSRHTAESLWAAVPVEGLQERTRLGPPGVDTHTFRLLERERWDESIDALVRWLDTAQRTGFDRRAAEAIDLLCDPRRDRPPDGESLAAVRAEYDPAGIDVQAPEALASLDPVREPTVVYVGKLIVSKGVDLLLAAWPLVLARQPDARLVVVGFGTYREGLEVLMRALETQDERLLSAVIRQGRALEGGERHPLTYLASFFEDLDGLAERYFAAARRLRESVVFLGRLEHGELGRILPVAEAVVVPSVFPEAFGMVAVEGAACGALPVCAAHSGLAEVAALLASGLPPSVRPLLTFERGMAAVRGIADRLNEWLALGERERRSVKERLADTAAGRFSWERVAEGVIAAAEGRLHRLDPVPTSAEAWTILPS